MENEELLEQNEEITTEYSGDFHERDSFIENNIVNEIQKSFIDYSLSVITARAIPDLKDGLKPVHRRILWSMYENGYTPDKPHRKCATTVGNVMGRYHPHGDAAIYDALVRLAQDFNERYTLVDGHGNFGNIEGDGAAASRYTEARLSKISLELLKDIKKDTVDMIPNFDGIYEEPVVLPSKFPNILVNGTMGIAVGMATNIPPHNLGEVIDGCIAYIDNPDIDTMGLMNYIKGPDFPTGGVILGNSGIRKAYETGRGSITIRSKATIEDKGTHQNIVITEVPYGVSTSDLKDRVAELVHNKIIEGISDYHTDLKNGLKITITLKRDANAQVVLNKLFKLTNFQVNFSIILLMLDNKTPKTLGLKDIISKYIAHQKEVIIRRTKYDLKKTEEEAHIYEGLKIALDNIDEIIKLIKASKTDEEAKNGLMSRFGLDDVQSQAILEMKLRRLTGLAREDVENHLDELHKTIEELKAILASDERIMGIIKDEMTDIKKKYSDDRRTKIDMTAIDYIEDESLIPVDNIIVNITKNGYIKRVPTDTYKVQNKGGVGVKGMTTNEEDIVENMISLQTHDHVLFFTNKGKVYRIKGYEIPEFSRQSKGLPVVNLLPIEKEEKVMSILPIRDSEDIGEKKITFVTKQGFVKRTDIAEFESIRKTGKIAIGLRETDEILTVMLTSGNDDILICADNGRMIRFNESEIRVLGRSASGVKGIEIPDDAKCVSAVVVKPEDEILIVTENGYGKRTNAEEYRLTHRGSKGVKAMNITEKNGPIVSVSKVEEDSDLIIITNNGMIIRIPLDQVSKMSRVTQGIRVITLKDDQKVSSTSISKIEEEKDENVEETTQEASESVE
ncbi:MAG: DNA gyrase subunit A [Bacilli bacterium]|nr:DNA gyrase subunit A [Bacilli bacterium]